MPMTVRYTVLDGEILSETRNGVEHDYVPDSLGSTVALLDDTQTPTDTFTYWPYGEVNTRFGSTATPFQFVGTRGYYRDSASRDYVRNRVLDKQKGRWLTQDPIGFDGSDWNLYQYVGNNPLNRVDPSGLQEDPGSGSQFGQLIAGFQCCADQAKPAIAAAARFCKQFGLGNPDDGTICNAMQHCMWACLIGQNCDDIAGLSGQNWALDCTDMHEKDAPWWWPTCPGYRQRPNPYYPNNPKDKCMDLFNNRIGINCSTAADCYTCCVIHAKRGGFQVVKPSKKWPPGWRPPRSGCRNDPTKVRLPSIE